jgi:ribosomal protein S18 acetylase RimI-like enzyme
LTARVSVRAVRAGDEARLRALRLRALTDSPEAFAAAAEQEAELPPAHWAELTRQSEVAEHLAIYVAVGGEDWLGMGAGRWHDRERGIAQLWGMWVDPAARRLGLGERLVTEVRAWAAARDARFLRLGVASRPGDPTPFYERLGFVRTGETRRMRTDPTRAAHFLVRPV